MSSVRLAFRLEATSGAARAAVIETRRGVIQTPAFMPVGTVGTVKTITPPELRSVGAQVILANTYHLYLRPGTETLEHFGGLHEFMRWPYPILTDSGGYQFFSLKRYAKFSDEGVAFQSHLDGSRHLFTPERVIDVQRSIGSDIMMVLDQCPALPASQQVLDEAVRRSTDWALRSLRHSVAVDAPGALFAIAQGGTNASLRRAHIEALSEHAFDGLALGGLAVGEAPEEMYDTVEDVAPLMPRDRPRYLMGVGRPEDIVECIARGVDIFDCVMPTRNARTGQVFTRIGKLNLRNARFVRDTRPLDVKCGCSTCAEYSRGYIHHLLRAGEVLGIRLTTVHNLAYYVGLANAARQAILSGQFDAFRRACHEGWNSGENC